MGIGFLVYQWFVLAVGVAAAGSILRRAARSDDGVGGLHVLRAMVWLAGGVGILTFVGMCAGVVRAFGVIRIGFMTGALALPVLAAGLIAARLLGRARVRPAALGLALVALAGAPLGWWMAFVEPYDLRVETADVVLPPERAGREPVRIAVFADLQCDAVGDHERRAVRDLLEQDADLILVPGDLFQGSAANWAAWKEPLLELLATIRAPHGVWFVPGDTDTTELIVALRQRTDWHVLINEIDDVEVRDRRIRIAGLANRASTSVADDLEGMRGDADVRIVMSHAPDTALHMSGRPRVDLIVAGHTHGGQIVVPGLGPPMTLSHVPREVASGGLHELRGRRVYVSRGIGLERRQAPRVRLLCPPEITVLTLRSASDEAP